MILAWQKGASQFSWVIKMDKFPEAFRRFEKRVRVDKIHSFLQLKMAFSYWAGRNWRDTRLQNEALTIEAEKRGIPVSRETEPRHPRVLIGREIGPTPATWTHKFVTVKGKRQSRYRDLKTGRFIKKPY